MKWVCLLTKGVVVKNFSETGYLYLYKKCNESETAFPFICITLSASKNTFGSFGLKKSIIFSTFNSRGSIFPDHRHEITLFTYTILESKFLDSPHPT